MTRGPKPKTDVQKAERAKPFQEWATQIKIASKLSTTQLESIFMLGRPDTQGARVGGDGRIWRAWMKGTRVPRRDSFMRISHIASTNGWLPRFFVLSDWRQRYYGDPIENDPEEERLDQMEYSMQLDRTVCNPFASVITILASHARACGISKSQFLELTLETLRASTEYAWMRAEDDLRASARRVADNATAYLLDGPQPPETSLR